MSSLEQTSRVVTWPNEGAFDALCSQAAPQIEAPAPGPLDDAARIRLWRAQEWHNWFRWRVCRKGTDWSKPAVIALLGFGFGLLIWDGWAHDRWYLTAGGIVAWFTAVNLSFFTYFGLTLPGPPLAVPGPLEAGRFYRAEMGLYPSGYERRKWARVWLRISANNGAAVRFELAHAKLPPELVSLLVAQTTWRMQRGDAPRTETVVETLPATRAEIDAGQSPLRIAAYQWNPQALAGFGRSGI